MLSTEEIVRLASMELSNSREPIVVYWLVAEDEDRASLAARIMSERAGCPILAVVLKDSLFLDPNSCAFDLVNLMEKHRSDIEKLDVDMSQWDYRLCLIIVSRRPLSVPQVGSAAEIPSWYPMYGGDSAFIYIRDLEGGSYLPLNSEVCNAKELARDLYFLEVALSARSVRAGETVWSNKQKQIMTLGFKGKKEFQEFVGRVTDVLEGVSTPDGYRPSAARADTWVGRLVNCVLASKPEGLKTKGAALVDLLALGDPSSRVQSLIGVVLRPTNREGMTARTEFGRNLIVTVYCAAQLITASAHADEYPKYSPAIIEGVSRDLRGALKMMREVIDSAPIVDAA